MKKVVKKLLFSYKQKKKKIKKKSKEN